MTYYVQYQVFLASCYQLSNKFRERVLQWYIIRGKTMAQQLKSWQNPCMTSGIKLVTIPYCTIYYLLCQEFLTVCVYP